MTNILHCDTIGYIEVRCIEVRYIDEEVKKVKSKKINRVWAISLFVAGITTMILVGSNFAGVKLPDIVLRITGVLDLFALFTLSFFTAKIFIKRD